MYYNELKNTSINLLFFLVIVLVFTKVRSTLLIEKERHAMSRKRQGNSSRVHLDIGAEHADELKTICEKLGTDVTKFVRLIVTTYLASYREFGKDLIWPPRFMTCDEVVALKPLAQARDVKKSRQKAC